nr:hypothetical protein [uncultured Rhodoferax sp.]
MADKGSGRIRALADKDFAQIEKERLRVSFEFIDWDTELFFLHGLEAEFYSRLFDCLNTIQSSTEDQLAKQNHPGLTCKSIFKSNTGTHGSFPVQVVERIKNKLTKEKSVEDAKSEATRIASLAFEVSMGKNQGRLHGFLWNKSFNLVWFDPAHNLYPGNHKVKSQKEFARIRCGSHEELMRLRELNTKDVNEYNELYEAFAAK